MFKLFLDSILKSITSTVLRNDMPMSNINMTQFQSNWDLKYQEYFINGLKNFIKFLKIKENNQNKEISRFISILKYSLVLNNLKMNSRLIYSFINELLPLLFNQMKSIDQTNVFIIFNHLQMNLLNNKIDLISLNGDLIHYNDVFDNWLSLGILQKLKTVDSISISFLSKLLINKWCKLTNLKFYNQNNQKQEIFETKLRKIVNVKELNLKIHNLFLDSCKEYDIDFLNLIAISWFVSNDNWYVFHF